MSLLTFHRTRVSPPAVSPPRLKVLFLAALAVVVVLMSVKYAAKISKPGDGGELTRSAFLRWRGMIHELFAGANVYVGVNEYPNPPIMAVILKPFASLPPITGALAWFYAKVLMAVLAAVWVFRLVGDVPDRAKALAVLLALPPLLGDLSHNNVNIFILFLVAACLEAYRRGWDVAAGLVLALAIACKVTPLTFAAYFVWKRKVRVVAACGVGLFLWLAVVPGAAFGWDRNIQLHTDWYKLMVERPILKGEVTSEHPNQALPGFVYRLFTRSPSFVVYPDNIPTPAEFHNVADIGLKGAWWTVKVAMGVFALAVVLLCRTPVVQRVSPKETAAWDGGRPERSGVRFAAEASLMVMGMLLFSERTWKHHGTVLLLPFAVLTCAAFAAEFTSRTRKWFAGVLVAVALLTIVPSMLRTRAADLALVYGTYTVAFLLLTVALCWVLASRPNPSTSAGVEPP
jgi:alpha-1,2-mannosyltransferase